METVDGQVAFCKCLCTHSSSPARRKRARTRAQMDARPRRRTCTLAQTNLRAARWCARMAWRQVLFEVKQNASSSRFELENAPDPMHAARTYALSDTAVALAFKPFKIGIVYEVCVLFFGAITDLDVTRPLQLSPTEPN